MRAQSLCHCFAQRLDSLRWLRFFLDDDAELQKIEEPSWEGCINVTEREFQDVYCMYCKKLRLVSCPPATLQLPWFPWTHHKSSQIYFHRSSMAVDRVRTIGALDRPGPSFVKFMTPQAVLARVLQDFWNSRVPANEIATGVPFQCVAWSVWRYRRCIHGLDGQLLRSRKSLSRYSRIWWNGTRTWGYWLRGGAWERCHGEWIGSLSNNVA